MDSRLSFSGDSEYKFGLGGTIAIIRCEFANWVASELWYFFAQPMRSRNESATMITLVLIFWRYWGMGGSATASLQLVTYQVMNCPTQVMP